MSSCNTCAKAFGFWNKETGCPKCKRVFCKKCLNHKVPESAENLKKMVWVCLRCSKLPLDNPLSANKKVTPDQLEDILKLSPNEQESFEPVLEPFSTTSYSDDVRKRLDALKEADVPENVEPAGDDDIAKRLANLKGVEFKENPGVSIKFLFTKDTRSEQEKIDDLLKQFVEEKTIGDELQPEPRTKGGIDDIERRLAALRGQDLEKTRLQIEQTEETEEDEADRTMKQYLEEAKLEDIVLDSDEEELINSIPSPPGAKKNQEELPFCEICNENASIRCLECENLFCRSCFKEFHDEEDYKTHKTKPYEAPKSNDF